MLRAAAVILAVAAASLTGCAADTEWRRADAPPSVTDDGLVAAPEAGVRFALPSGWQVVVGPGMESWTEESAELAADSMGITVEELERLAAEVDLVARGPGGATMNVNTIHGTSTLPTGEDLLTVFGPNTALTLRDVHPVSTHLGKAQMVRYDVDVMGRPGEGRAVFLVVDDHLAHITVTTVGTGRAGAVMTRVLATLERS